MEDNSNSSIFSLDRPSSLTNNFSNTQFEGQDEEMKEPSSKAEFAMKVYYSDAQKKLGRKEYRVMQKIERIGAGNYHPNIVRATSYHQSQRLVTKTGLTNISEGNEVDISQLPYDCMTMEYCPNSDLFELVK